MEASLVLRVAAPPYMTTMNPLMAGNGGTWNFLDFIYDKPIKIDEYSNLIPYIAVGSANLSTDLDVVDWNDCMIGNFGYIPKDTWENDAKPEAIIFFDFEGVKWHDGEQMTIRDVLFSFHAQSLSDVSSNYRIVFLKNIGGEDDDSHFLNIYPVWESNDHLQAALRFQLQVSYANFFENSLSIFLLPYHIWGSTESGQPYDNMKIWLDEGYLSSAVKLLDETFINKYDEVRFIRFVKEAFNNIQVSPKSYGPWKEFQDYITSYKQLASFKDQEKRTIDILMVDLKKASSRDRARTMQRNFIAKYLVTEGKDAALVAFHGDEQEDWRFSFVKMEYDLVRGEDGKVREEKELTPVKRYSFLVGPNEPNHTCRSQFRDIVMEDGRNPTISEIEAAFSIDNVTKEFFLKYKELFHKLEESLTTLKEKDKYIRKEFEEKEISTIDFSKKLLGQIVFLHFLQKKGWLGVQKDADGRFMEWGTGPKDFMKRLFEKKIVDYDNFYNDVLEPLFYEALATEHDNDYYSKLKCRIPFLNGGLFEPINEFNWAETKMVIDNRIFDDIFKVFNQYNFTVKEDEPLDKEVAVDPEMLGKVFENLLDVKDRKDRGAFYTPLLYLNLMKTQWN